MQHITEYDNGLRLITNEFPDNESATCVFAFGTGSGSETEENNGISHFLEHVIFKGTKRFTSEQISNIFEDCGARNNAYTSKEKTCYYFKSIRENFETCFDLLSDIVLNSVFPEEELEKERGAIEEEINMNFDNPGSICYDIACKLMYGSRHPLGNTILGPLENVSSFKADDVKKYFKSNYCTDNFVISIAGCISHEQAKKLVEKYVLPGIFNNRAGTPFEFYSPHKNPDGGYIQYLKDFEQTTISICFPGLDYRNENKILETIALKCLGDGMSSRLFQQLREKRGLVYEVSASSTEYYNNGLIWIDFSTGGSKLTESVKTVRNVLNVFAEKGLTEQEFKRVLVQLKCSLIYGWENNMSIANLNSTEMLYNGKGFDRKEYLSKVNSVTIEQLNEFIKNLFDYSRVGIAYVGDEKHIKDSDLTKIFLY